MATTLGDRQSGLRYSTTDDPGGNRRSTSLWAKDPASDATTNLSNDHSSGFNEINAENKGVSIENSPISNTDTGHAFVLGSPTYYDNMTRGLSAVNITPGSTSLKWDYNPFIATEDYHVATKKYVDDNPGNTIVSPDGNSSIVVDNELITTQSAGGINRFASVMQDGVMSREKVHVSDIYPSVSSGISDQFQRTFENQGIKELVVGANPYERNDDPSSTSPGFIDYRNSYTIGMFASDGPSQPAGIYATTKGAVTSADIFHEINAFVATEPGHIATKKYVDNAPAVNSLLGFLQLNDSTASYFKVSFLDGPRVTLNKFNGDHVDLTPYRYSAGGSVTWFDSEVNVRTGYIGWVSADGGYGFLNLDGGLAMTNEVPVVGGIIKILHPTTE